MALSSDKDKPIELEADSADINDKNGMSMLDITICNHPSWWRVLI
jgi:hypothetical protein